MAEHQRWGKVTVEEGMARIPGSSARRFTEMLRHGSLQVELYAPRLIAWVIFYGPEGGER